MHECVKSGCRVRLLTNKNPEEISGVPRKDQCQISDQAAPSKSKNEFSKREQDVVNPISQCVQFVGFD
jgi:hypothetical protein